MPQKNRIGSCQPAYDSWLLDVFVFTGMIKNIALQLCFCIGVVMVTANAVHALENVKIIDRAQTEHLLQKGAVFIDNRPEYKFSLGHIEGAINLPYFIANDPSNKMTKENLVRAIGDNDLVVFYCTGMERAYHALKQAQQWGITAEMYWYKNGFEEWKMFHLPHLD